MISPSAVDVWHTSNLHITNLVDLDVISTLTARTGNVSVNKVLPVGGTQNTHTNKHTHTHAHTHMDAYIDTHTHTYIHSFVTSTS